MSNSDWWSQMRGEKRRRGRDYGSGFACDYDFTRNSIQIFNSHLIKTTGQNHTSRRGRIMRLDRSAVRGRWIFNSIIRLILYKRLGIWHWELGIKAVLGVANGIRTFVQYIDWLKIILINLLTLDTTDTVQHITERRVESLLLRENFLIQLLPEGEPHSTKVRIGKQASREPIAAQAAAVACVGNWQVQTTSWNRIFNGYDDGIGVCVEDEKNKSQGTVQYSTGTVGFWDLRLNRLLN